MFICSIFAVFLHSDGFDPTSAIAQALANKLHPSGTLTYNSLEVAACESAAAEIYARIAALAPEAQATGHHAGRLNELLATAHSKAAQAADLERRQLSELDQLREYHKRLLAAADRAKEAERAARLQWVAHNADAVAAAARAMALPEGALPPGVGLGADGAQVALPPSLADPRLVVPYHLQPQGAGGNAGAGTGTGVTSGMHSRNPSLGGSNSLFNPNNMNGGMTPGVNRNGDANVNAPAAAAVLPGGFSYPYPPMNNHAAAAAPVVPALVPGSVLVLGPDGALRANGAAVPPQALAALLAQTLSAATNTNTSPNSNNAALAGQMVAVSRQGTRHTSPVAPMHGAAFSGAGGLTAGPRSSPNQQGPFAAQFQPQSLQPAAIAVIDDNIVANTREPPPQSPAMTMNAAGANAAGLSVHSLGLVVSDANNNNNMNMKNNQQSEVFGSGGYDPNAAAGAGVTGAPMHNYGRPAEVLNDSISDLTDGESLSGSVSASAASLFALPPPRPFAADNTEQQQQQPRPESSIDLERVPQTSPAAYYQHQRGPLSQHQQKQQQQQQKEFSGGSSHGSPFAPLSSGSNAKRSSAIFTFGLPESHGEAALHAPAQAQAQQHGTGVPAAANSAQQQQQQQQQQRQTGPSSDEEPWVEKGGHAHSAHGRPAGHGHAYDGPERHGSNGLGLPNDSPSAAAASRHLSSGQQQRGDKRGNGSRPVSASSSVSSLGADRGSRHNGDNAQGRNSQRPQQRGYDNDSGDNGAHEYDGNTRTPHQLHSRGQGQGQGQGAAGKRGGDSSGTRSRTRTPGSIAASLYNDSDFGAKRYINDARQGHNAKGAGYDGDDNDIDQGGDYDDNANNAHDAYKHARGRERQAYATVDEDALLHSAFEIVDDDKNNQESDNMHDMYNDDRRSYLNNERTRPPSASDSRRNGGARQHQPSRPCNRNGNQYQQPQQQQSQQQRLEPRSADLSRPPSSFGQRYNSYEHTAHDDNDTRDRDRNRDRGRDYDRERDSENDRFSVAPSVERPESAARRRAEVTARGAYEPVPPRRAAAGNFGVAPPQRGWAVLPPSGYPHYAQQQQYQQQQPYSQQQYPQQQQQRRLLPASVSAPPPPQHAPLMRGPPLAVLPSGAAAQLAAARAALAAAQLSQSHAAVVAGGAAAEAALLQAAHATRQRRGTAQAAALATAVGAREAEALRRGQGAKAAAVVCRHGGYMQWLIGGDGAALVSALVPQQAQPHPQQQQQQRPVMPQQHMQQQQQSQQYQQHGPASRDYDRDRDRDSAYACDGDRGHDRDYSRERARARGYERGYDRERNDTGDRYNRVDNHRHYDRKDARKSSPVNDRDRHYDDDNDDEGRDNCDDNDYNRVRSHNINRRDDHPSQSQSRAHHDDRNRDYDHDHGHERDHDRDHDLEREREQDREYGTRDVRPPRPSPRTVLSEQRASNGHIHPGPNGGDDDAADDVVDADDRDAHTTNDDDDAASAFVDPAAAEWAAFDPSRRPTRSSASSPAATPVPPLPLSAHSLAQSHLSSNASVSAGQQQQQLLQQQKRRPTAPPPRASSPPSNPAGSVKPPADNEKGVLPPPRPPVPSRIVTATRRQPPSQQQPQQLAQGPQQQGQQRVASAAAAAVNKKYRRERQAALAMLLAAGAANSALQQQQQPEDGAGADVDADAEAGIGGWDNVGDQRLVR